MYKRIVVVPVFTIVLILDLAASDIHLPLLTQAASEETTFDSEMPDENLIYLPLISNKPWPDLCYAPGTQNYQPPVVEIPEIILQHGITITVGTNNDEINGSVSSVSALLSNPGPDGIALREVIEATNNDPGEYTINFSPSLDGSTIYTGGWNNQDLPPLLGGSVIINGDIDGDSTPDITLTNGRTDNPYAMAFTIQSSNNTLHALELTGYYQAVLIKPTTTNTTYSGIHISNMDISDSSTGILLTSEECCTTTQPTYNRWEGIIILGNTIDVTSFGIALHLINTIEDHLDEVMVVGNQIRVTQDIYGDTNGVGIGFMSGFWDGSDGNSITNVTLYQNTIQGNGRSSIAFMSGAVGASGNTVDGVLVYENKILISGGDWAKQAGRLGINLITGDGATDHMDPEYPLVSPNYNAIRNVEIIGNTVEGFVGNGIVLSGADGTGASYNTIENITILDNHLATTVTDGDYHNSEISIEGGSGKPGVLSTGNRVSNIIVQQNTIHHSAQTALNDIYLSNGSIMIVGADDTGPEQNYVQDIWISLNEIDSIIPSISLTGSNGFEARWNEIDRANIYCNTITRSPIYPIWFPPLKGIVLIGGIHDSEFNRVEASLYHNNVVGVTNDLTVIPNGDEASYGNVVDYQIIP